MIQYLVPMQRQMNPFHTFQPDVFNSHFNIIHISTPRLSNCTLWVSWWNFFVFLSHICPLHPRSSHAPWVEHPGSSLFSAYELWRPGHTIFVGLLLFPRYYVEISPPCSQTTTLSDLYCKRQSFTHSITCKSVLSWVHQSSKGDIYYTFNRLDTT